MIANLTIIRTLGSMTSDVSVGTVISKALCKFEVMELKLRIYSEAEFGGSGDVSAGSP